MAWRKTAEGRRVFYTALGRWDDFNLDAFRRLLDNAVRWALSSAKS